jgi:hypothetical protein
MQTKIAKVMTDFGPVTLNLVVCNNCNKEFTLEAASRGFYVHTDFNPEADENPRRTGFLCCAHCAVEFFQRGHTL